MIKRISVRFNTDFKEDKELLETLEKSEIKTATSRWH